MSGLVELARRYVNLSDQLEGVREPIKRALVHGAGDAGPPRPMQARSKPGGHPNTVKAAEVDQRVIALIRDHPGMKTGALAKETGSRMSTMAERLRRLKARGEVHGGGDGGWPAPG